jgi:hypothetical protein
MSTLKTSLAIGEPRVKGHVDIYAAVISAAKAKMYFEDFKIDGRLSGNVAQSYDARMAAFRHLEEQGFVRLEDSRLSLGLLTEIPWLSEAISFGDSAAWRICDAFPQGAKKFEPDNFRLTEIGLEGEKFVIDWLHNNLPFEKLSQIVHVSLSDDSAGYDISTPTLKFADSVALEVKTTTRDTEDFSFHLSRNEWEVSQRYVNWYLVLIRKHQGLHEIFGYLDGKSLGSYFPSDNHPHFQWSSSNGRLSQDDLFQVMPGF